MSIDDDADLPERERERAQESLSRCHCIAARAVIHKTSASDGRDVVERGSIERSEYIGSRAHYNDVRRPFRGVEIYGRN